MLMFKHNKRENKNMAIQLPAPLVPQKLTLAPAMVQEDALIKAIQDDPLGTADENTFDLHEDIDPARIEAFLDEALSDMTAAERKAAQDL